ncbi:MAG: hypothetical protein Q7S00_06000, partial [bacterium]|nr:hypothetical protein [bacterium]
MVDAHIKIDDADFPFEVDIPYTSDGDNQVDPEELQEVIRNLNPLLSSYNENLESSGGVPLDLSQQASLEKIQIRMEGKASNAWALLNPPRTSRTGSSSVGGSTASSGKAQILFEGSLYTPTETAAIDKLKAVKFDKIKELTSAEANIAWEVINAVADELQKAHPEKTRVEIIKDLKLVSNEYDNSTRSDHIYTGEEIAKAKGVTLHTPIRVIAILDAGGQKPAKWADIKLENPTDPNLTDVDL